jgi:glyoxylase-like metal-dependent hydrolase (beta-lactamase superfamily II)
VSAQTDWASVEIETLPVAEGVYMLVGRGGNIGVSVGEDGAFVIDDQYAPLTEKIVAAIGQLTDGPIPFVINTHWHGDHVGGNEKMGDAGSVLVAHHRVRERMEVEQVLERFGRVDTVAASPSGALPVVTFTEEVTFHLNGDDLRVLHVPHAHTDGDAIIHFVGANVVHMGDTYFASGYPFIDLSSGGGIDGVLEALGRALALMDADTRVIPGHGPLSSRADLREYRDMLKTVRDRVAEAKAAGHSLEEVLEMGLTAPWDEEWGGGFINPAAFVTSVYGSLPAAR